MNQDFQKNRYDLEEVRKLWRQTPDDNRVFRAATEDIEEYPPEIQTIIKEEAERRRTSQANTEPIPKQTMLQRGFSSVGLHYDPKETKGDVKKKDKGWFGATNWKQKVVWVVAIIIYVTMCQSVLSPFSGVVRVGLAAVFGAIVGLLTGIFGDKKEKQPKDDRKNQT